MKEVKGKIKVGMKTEVINVLNTKTIIIKIMLLRNGSEIECQSFSYLLTRF